MIRMMNNVGLKNATISIAGPERNKTRMHRRVSKSVLTAETIITVSKKWNAKKKPNLIN